MTEGIRINYGETLGKTIIFAEIMIMLKRFWKFLGKNIPNFRDMQKLLIIIRPYAQSAIDEFAEPGKLPQIAISVDMLDTGIDVPEVVNLVFFKKVMSKSKFWQMIGRGNPALSGTSGWRR